LTTTSTEELRAFYETEYLTQHPDLDVGDVRAKFEGLREFLDLAAASQPQAGRTVVEIGCGSGLLLQMVSRHLGAHGVGVDLSASILTKARRTSPGLSFVQANAEQLPLALRRCDLIVFADLVEHVPHPREFLASLGEAPQVAMLVPLESGWFSDLVYRYRRLIGKPTNYETCGHLHRWTVRSALRLIRSAGLQVVAHEVRPGKFTQYTTWRGRLYGALSGALSRAWPGLHQRVFGGYTLLALCRADEHD
jgi:SAM-dependent methyltransferase